MNRIRINRKIVEYSCITGLGLLGGAIGELSKLPGGVIVITLILVGIGNIAGLPANHLPRKTGFWLQVLAGLLIGVQITPDELFSIVVVLPQLLAIIGTLLLMSFLSTFIFVNVFSWDVMTAWLSSAPGRMSDMIIIANSLGVNTERVAATHIVRIALVVIVTPLVLFFS